MLHCVVHIAACLASFGDSTCWEPAKIPVPMVDTVRIRAERIEFANIGRRELKLHQETGFGLLSQNMQEAAQFFKEYGVSGSATISKRGADATQTQVLWNGLPINHPMLGMMDFNGVSTFGMDEMILIEGGNSAMYGSGSVGGTVVLNNQIHFNSPLKLRINAEANSLGNLQSGFQISKGNNRSYINLTSSWMDRANDFDFFDPIKQAIRTSFNNHLTLQNIRLVAAHALRSHQIKVISELGRVDRGLGFLYGSNQALGQQSDLQSRNLVQYDYHQKRFHFSQKAGFTSDRLIYSETENSGDTSIANMWFLQTEIYKQTQWGRALLGLDYQIQEGKSKYYESTTQRILPAIFSAWKGEVGKTAYLMNARYEFKEQVITGGIGTQTPLTNGFSFKTDIHRSFRRPTLNDLYWQVSKRNNLTPEIGWGTEIGILWHQTMIPGLDVKVELTPFYRELNNPIIWLPQGAFWAAQNLFFGRYAGVQIFTQLSKKNGTVSWHIREHFEWVRSAVKVQKESDYLHQIFVPDIMSTTQLKVALKWINLSVNWQKVGNRYTTTDNSSILPFYQLFSLETSFKSSIWGLLKNGHSQWSFGAHNILNAQYQNMPGRPMPPRNIYLKLNITM